ncbi:MAG: M67 family metallopeptidase [Nitrospirota bacterium]|nr:M67 family metallopeptidase [Nitrospirota bacterium]
MREKSLFIPKNLFEEMLSHCREVYPNEACGILAGNGEEASKIYRITNSENSPVTYKFESTEHIRADIDIRENKLAMLAIYHSHPSSVAYPSQKDIEDAFWDGDPNYPDAVYVIVSLIKEQPVVKGFSIREGAVKEVRISVK